MSRDHAPSQHDRLDEPALVAGLLCADTQARNEFVVRAHDAVYAFACRVTAHPEQRRDWTHDCLRRILDDLALGAFVDGRPGGFWAWFRRRTWFLILESQRNHELRESRFLPVEEQDVEATEETVTPDNLELASALEACIERLDSPDQRRMLRLLYWQKLTYGDIATATGEAPQTVRAQILSGRTSVRSCLRARLGLMPEKEDS